MDAADQSSISRAADCCVRIGSTAAPIWVDVMTERAREMAANQPPTEPEKQNPRLTIVGIGASAGGVQALQTLFDALPAQTGVAFVVVVHLDPESQSELALIL